ncbi:MAG TPA: hypothetical protein VG245_02090 [Candidatus Dormibacteraeota bacterium]|nr:hypothetical protein [Candidatus Dormibacteraeota bacterium]
MRSETIRRLTDADAPLVVGGVTTSCVQSCACSDPSCQSLSLASQCPTSGCVAC